MKTRELWDKAIWKNITFIWVENGSNCDLLIKIISTLQDPFWCKVDRLVHHIVMKFKNGNAHTSPAILHSCSNKSRLRLVIPHPAPLLSSLPTFFLFFFLDFSDYAVGGVRLSWYLNSTTKLIHTSILCPPIKYFMDSHCHGNNTAPPASPPLFPVLWLARIHSLVLIGIYSFVLIN